MNHFVRVAADQWNFERGGQPFYCMGVNYFPSDAGWAPQIWQQFDMEKTRRHFALMEEAGIRVARVFLTWASFLPKRKAGLDSQAMNRLGQMLKAANEFNILLHPTGPDHWEGASDWMDYERDHYVNRSVLETLPEFWTQICGELKDCPDIFAWDILNEPHMKQMSVEQSEEWVVWRANQPDSTALPENYPHTLPDNPEIRAAYLRFRGQMARHWIQIQTDAIRAMDPNHLISVGLLWFTGTDYGPEYAFDPAFMDDLVDFSCIHYYPPTECCTEPARYDLALDELELFLRTYYMGKPLVLQEFGWYGTNEEFSGWGQEGFIRQNENVQAEMMSRLLQRTRGLCSGWLPWGLLDVPSARDLSKYSGLFTSSEQPKAYRKVYADFCADVCARGLVRRHAPIRSVDLDASMRCTDKQSRWNEWLKSQRTIGPFDFSFAGGGVKPQ